MKRVDRAARRLPLIRFLPDFVRIAAAFHGGRRDVRIHARSEHPGVQLTADRQRGIANRLHFQALERHAPQQAVFRILLTIFRIPLLAHAIRVAGHDQPVEFLDGPAVVHEPGCQPVQQLGMRGLVTHHAEVARSSHQAFSEVMLPDAIHDHPRGQRIVRAHQPLGQGQAALTGSCRRGEDRLCGPEFPAPREGLRDPVAWLCRGSGGRWLEGWLWAH